MGDDVDRAIAENVRLYREAAGVTQRELAARLTSLGWSIDNTAIARIEAGKRALRAGQLVQIARVLDRPVSDFVENDMVAAANLGVSALTRSLVQLEHETLSVLGTRNYLRQRINHFPGLDGWGARPLADRLLDLDLSRLVAQVVREWEESGGSAGLRTESGALRDPRTFSGSEINGRVQRYIDWAAEEVSDGEHQEEA